MEISALLNEVPLPRISNRAREIFKFSNNVEPQFMRTSMPNILNPDSQLDQFAPGNRTMSSLCTYLDNMSLSGSPTSSTSTTPSVFDSPTTTTMNLSPASSILESPGSSEPRSTSTNLPSLKMLHIYILNGPNVPVTSLELAPMALGTLVLSTASFGQFEQYQRRNFLSFDGIDIIAPISPRGRTPFENHFDTITFDLRNLPNDDRYRVAPEAGWLIMTSSSARQLVVKDTLHRSWRDSAAPFDLRDIEKFLGVEPIMMVKADGMYWIWEHATGDKLSWSSWPYWESPPSEGNA